MVREQAAEVAAVLRKAYPETTFDIVAIENIRRHVAEKERQMFGDDFLLPEQWPRPLTAKEMVLRNIPLPPDMAPPSLSSFTREDFGKELARLRMKIKAHERMMERVTPSCTAEFWNQCRPVVHVPNQDREAPARVLKRKEAQQEVDEDVVRQQTRQEKKAQQMRLQEKKAQQMRQQTKLRQQQ